MRAKSVRKDSQGRRRGMEAEAAAAALSALALPGRLEIFRLLVKAGKDGMAAGEIASATGSLANTLSANLNILSHAGLITSRRAGRSVIYAADYRSISALIGFLMEDCCGGHKEICEPLIAIAQRAWC